MFLSHGTSEWNPTSDTIITAFFFWCQEPQWILALTLLQGKVDRSSPNRWHKVGRQLLGPTHSAQLTTSCFLHLSPPQNNDLCLCELTWACHLCSSFSSNAMYFGSVLFTSTKFSFLYKSSLYHQRSSMTLLMISDVTRQQANSDYINRICVLIIRSCYKHGLWYDTGSELAFCLHHITL